MQGGDCAAEGEVRGRFLVWMEIGEAHLGMGVPFFYPFINPTFCYKHFWGSVALFFRFAPNSSIFSVTQSNVKSPKATLAGLDIMLKFQMVILVLIT